MRGAYRAIDSPLFATYIICLPMVPRSVEATRGLSSSMDPQLRADILKLLDNNFDEMPEINRSLAIHNRKGQICLMLEGNSELQKVYNKKVINGQEDPKEFFGKKTSKVFFEEQLQDLESHFSSEYLRNENVVKVRGIIEMYLGNYRTLNFAPLVHPSMSGKSRLVSELAKSVPTIYSCFRNKESTGYPMCTEGSMLFFQKLLKIKRRAKRENILVRCFLSIITELVSMNLQNMVDLWKGQAEGGKSFFDESCLRMNIKLPSVAEMEDVWRKYNQKLGGKGKLKLLFVFDEARFLLKESKDGVSLLRNIRRSLDTLQSFMRGIFILFVDTTLHVGDFSPSIKDEVSNRYSTSDADSKRLNAPIYTFDTFDVFHGNHTVSLSDVGSEESYLRMGRPGWSIFKFAEVIRIAKGKILFGNESLDKSYMTGRLASVMCIYAVNLRGSTELASLLIGSHMAFPRYISASRSVISCFYRSEPVLVLGAHAALQELNVLEVFNYFLQNGEIESGERGEVVVRLLITHCVTQYFHENNIYRPYGLNWLSLSKFFEALHLEVPSSAILESGRVHFTHWVQIPCELQPHILLKCHYRGAAIKCKTNQRGIDLVIPVFIDTPENRRAIDRLKLTHSMLDGAAPLRKDVEDTIKKVFSVVAVQVKSNPLSSDPETLSHLDEQVNSLLGEVCHDQPYVFHLQMSGNLGGGDKVVNEPNCVGIYRQSAEAWSFSKLDVEYLRNLLTFRVMPDKDLECENAEILANERDSFLSTFCDFKESIPKSESPPRKQRKKKKKL